MPRPIALVIFPEVKLLDVTGPLQVFNDAWEPDRQERAYAPALYSLTGGSVPTDSPVALDSRPLAELEQAPPHTLLVAGGWGTRDAVCNADLLAAIGRAARGAERLGSICTGSFLLAAAGLLDGRQATTHWESCQRLQRAFPEVDVAKDPIFVRDGHVWTSAGVTAGIDMALAMVAEDLGRTAAMTLARSLVTFMVRPGGQSQFSSQLQQQTSDAQGRFDRLHDWMRDNLAADLRVEALAERMNMSLRSFNRIYREETGRTPAKAVEIQRLEAARRMLSESERSVSQVAVASGFGDDERMRRVFLRHLSVAPAEYRRRFRAA